MELRGVGPIVAARVLVDVGDVTGFADRNRFASWTGTAPIEASSGEQIRHRLSRAGNRRMTTWSTSPRRPRFASTPKAGATGDANSPPERRAWLRCLKRRISDPVYRQLLADARRAAVSNAREPSKANPGGHCGATHQSSAVDLPPDTDTSNQPLPRPTDSTLQPTSRPRKTAANRPLQTAS